MPATLRNRQIAVAQRPRYTVPTANVFRLRIADQPKVGPGQVRIRTTWLGLDAHLYRRLKQVSTTEPLPIDSVMAGPTVGRVEVSNRPDFKEGDIVHGAWGWQDWDVSGGTDIAKVDPALPRPSYQLGAFGQSGFEAFVTVCELLKLRRG